MSGATKKLRPTLDRSTPAAPSADQASHAYLRVADTIKVRILSGELKPGDRLPNEIELAKETGVGRTTIREALRLLAAARLIETRRGVNGGAFVTHPNVDDLDDLMMTGLSLIAMSGELGDQEIADATTYLMPTAARIAALRGSDKEIEMLDKLAASLSSARSDEDWVKVGTQFNTLVIDMSRNRVIALLVKPLMRVSPMRYQKHRQAPGWREAAALRYQELADAIRRRAPAAAEEASLRVCRHYSPD
jgi:DNA-binding FadR family transcriptional regulator